MTMTLLKNASRLLALAPLALLCIGVSAAQSSTGSSGTTCTQSGTEVTCTTVTKYTLPSGVSLQSGAVGAGNFQLVGAGTPGCSGLGATPQTVVENQATNVSLSIAGCAANSIFTWQAPAAASSTASSSHQLTLTATNTSQSYAVQVCLPGATTSPGCQTYGATVGLTGATPPLQGCTVSPSSTSISTTGSTNLSVSCAQGTGANSGVTYQWRRDGQNIVGQTSSTHAVTGSALAAGVYVYTVSLTNNASQTPVISASSAVTITNSSGGGSFALCPSGMTTPAATIRVQDGYKTWISTDFRQHPGSTPYVIAIDVPEFASWPAGVDFDARLNYSQYSGSSARQVSISRTPCDFSSQIPDDGSRFVAFNYNPSLSAPYRGATLTSGRWYVNLRSTPLSVTDRTCPADVSCSMNIQYQP
jgi:hypothetical protein